MGRGIIFLVAVSAAAATLWPAAAGCSSGGSDSSAEPATWEERIAKTNLAEDEFTALCAEAIAARLPDAVVTVLAPGEIDVTLDQDSSNWFVGDLWDQCAHTPSNRAELCQTYFDSLVQAARATHQTTPPGDPSGIVPLVRSEFFVKELQRASRGKGDPVAEQLAADLWVVYSIGAESEHRFVTEPDAAQMGLTPADIRTMAVENLRRITTHKVKQSGKGPYILSVGGSYEASLLLLDEIWDSPAKMVAGDLVVVAPNPNLILFTGADSDAGVRGMMQYADREFKRSAVPISRTLLVRRKGKWQRFDLPAEAPPAAAPVSKSGSLEHLAQTGHIRLNWIKLAS